MARTVYLDYRKEVDADMSEYLNLPSQEQGLHTIPETERTSRLHELLSDFDLADAAQKYAGIALQQSGLAIPPDSADYAKLLKRIREGFTQVYVDIVNLYANTPARDDNPYFIDPVSQEPKPPARTSNTESPVGFALSNLVPVVMEEVRVSRGKKGIAKFQRTLDLMCEFLGPLTDVRTIERSSILAFRTALTQLPTNATKRYPNLGMKDAIGARIPEHDTLAISTINGHMRDVKQFFSTCSMNIPNLQTPNLDRLSLHDPVDAMDKRYPFTSDQIISILKFAKTSSLGTDDDALFWICMIGLFHGLRANEIATLETTHIIQVHGTTCIDLKLPKALVNGERNGSSKTIPRKIPLHPALIQIGFPDYVASLPTGMIFYELTPADDGYLSRKITGWCTDAIKSLGLAGRKLSFHSFRHTFLDELDAVGLPEKWKAYLGGWKSDGVMNKNYGSNEVKAYIIPAIGKLKYCDAVQEYVDMIAINRRPNE